jgi:hypothetical protein
MKIDLLLIPGGSAGVWFSLHGRPDPLRKTGRQTRNLSSLFGVYGFPCTGKGIVNQRGLFLEIAGIQTRAF